MWVSEKADWPIARAAHLLVDAPYVKGPNSMRASSFSGGNSTLIMCIWWKNAQLIKEDKKEVGDIPFSFDVVKDDLVVCKLSPLTTSVVMDPSSVEEEVVHKQKKIKQICWNASQSQQWRANFRHRKDINKLPHKNSWYAKERYKGAIKMSAREVCQRVNKEYGTSLTPRTISR